MIKIMAILKEKIEEQKLQNKINKVKNCIQASRLQAETDLMELSDRKIQTVESLKDRETSTVLEQLVGLQNKENSIKEQLGVLAQVEKFLFEDIKQEK